VLWTTTTILLACRRRVHGHHDTAKNTVLLPLISFAKKNNHSILETKAIHVPKIAN
jgi:hypothetical protein